MERSLLFVVHVWRLPAAREGRASKRQIQPRHRIEVFVGGFIGNIQAVFFLEISHRSFNKLWRKIKRHKKALFYGQGKEKIFRELK